MRERKKAVVVGGSNGIGLAISLEWLNRGYHVVVVDKVKPDSEALSSEQDCTFFPCDLMYPDYDLFHTLSEDGSVESLMITAGFGRVADFQFLHQGEIQKLLQVNAAAAIQVIRCFYHRVRGITPFFCGVMGSIAGWVSSPMFSVYAASKAAVCRFVESVNCELEQAGTANRILDVSPGSFSGSRFNGGENKVEELAPLAKEIVEKLLESCPLYIPRYEEVYRDVLARYHAAPHKFGMESYQYKLQSGRAKNERGAVIGYLSGTFDLFHIGHLNLIRRAKQHCDYLIVGVHPNAAHKGKTTFIPFEERMEIVGACRYVDKVVESCPEDSEAWERWHYDRLFVGSDYKGTPRFMRYEDFFSDKDVEIIYFPYTSETNSTQIRKMIDEQRKKQ